MLIIDYAKYVMGEKSPWTLGKEPYRATEEDLKEASELLEKHVTAADNLKVMHSPKLFFSREVDFSNDLPKHKREELFYALKLGYASTVAPAKLIWYIETAVKEYGSPNFLFKIALEKDMQDFLSEGYLSDGYTVRDVICSVAKLPNYTPLSEGKLAVQIGDHWDLYIHDTDAIAMVPADLKELLSHDDISKLKVKSQKIYIGDKPVCQLGRYIGAVNSCYDLRRLL